MELLLECQSSFITVVVPLFIIPFRFRDELSLNHRDCRLTVLDEFVYYNITGLTLFTSFDRRMFRWAGKLRWRASIKRKPYYLQELNQRQGKNGELGRWASWNSHSFWVWIEHHPDSYLYVQVHLWERNRGQSKERHRTDEKGELKKIIWIIILRLSLIWRVKKYETVRQNVRN